MSKPKQKVTPPASESAREGILSQEDAHRILKKDVANIVQKVAKGKSLSPAERKLVKDLSEPVHVPWAEIRQKYITGNFSQSDLARIYSVPVKTIQTRCTAEGWVAQKERFIESTQERAVDKASNEIAEWLSSEFRRARKMATDVDAHWDATLDIMDSETINRLVSARLNVHRLGRLSSGVEDEQAAKRGDAATTAAVERIVQSIIILRSAVQSGKLDPRTIDVETLKAATIEDDENQTT